MATPLGASFSVAVAAAAMATPFVASLSVAAAAMRGRYLIQALQAFESLPVVPVSESRLLLTRSSS